MSHPLNARDKVSVSGRWSSKQESEPKARSRLSVIFKRYVVVFQRSGEWIDDTQRATSSRSFGGALRGAAPAVLGTHLHDNIVQSSSECFTPLWDLRAGQDKS